ncbi:MAG: YihY/virulence factor BrkB family protein [Pseudomonadota bacterium]
MRRSTIHIGQYLERLIWDERYYGSGVLGRALAVVLRYLYALVRDLASGQLTMRAMSLVYTTLLSIVPLLAFSFAILKGLGKFDDLEPYLPGLLAPAFGDESTRITQEILTLVNNVRGSVLGGFGLAFFLYTAISMVQKVEESFNYVWYVAKPRSFARRFSEYLVVLLVGPMLMVTAIGMITSIRSNTVVQYILNNPQLGSLFVYAGKIVPYLLISGVFTFLYMFMPNARVRLRSALVGGVCGGVMWATVGAVFTTFVLYSTRTLAIYAGFAVAITTLVWLYLNWLILLIGSQIAFYHQRPAFLRIGRREPRPSNAIRERLALNIMYLAGSAFRNPRGPLTFGELSTETKIPSLTLTPVVNALEKAGLLITTDKEELIPGREMSRIPLRDILNVVRVAGETGSDLPPQWTGGVEQIGRSLDDAVLATLQERTLADLLDADGVAQAGVNA